MVQKNQCNPDWCKTIEGLPAYDKNDCATCLEEHEKAKFLNNVAKQSQAIDQGLREQGAYLTLSATQYNNKSGGRAVRLSKKPSSGGSKSKYTKTAQSARVTVKGTVVTRTVYKKDGARYYRTKTPSGKVVYRKI